MRTDLPTGTVTFLFTDVEGSTKLLDELGTVDYASALAEHRRVLREAFSAHGGIEVDTQGDAFFVAFSTATGALAAAAEAKEQLAAGPIRVRVGIHTGTPHIGGEGYVGLDVHRAARIAAVGHGGQVLVSATTAALSDTNDLNDLGEHRLQDLSAAERIFQLGDEVFPRLKSLFQTNLPIPPTPFLGRERELDEVNELLSRDDVRLLTLSGAGGIGKTRLAQHAAAGLAESYSHGVWWVPLAPLRDPKLVLDAAGQAVGAREQLAGHIGDKRMLLLLDNFEHLVQAAGDVAALLASCPSVDLLVTSRELLRVPAEHAYPVRPLKPEDATQLFLARARAGAPGFAGDDAVGELCARLENLPLALELAAARVRALSPEQLVERLSGRLDLLKAGRAVDPRQQTLRATLEWSHSLLSRDEQGLFASLSVFRGGFTVEAAEAVAEADIDTLQALVDKSLLTHGDGRYGMLETIREYAAERLGLPGRDDGLLRAHAEYFLAAAERARQKRDAGIDEGDWSRWGAIERANLLGALDTFRTQGDRHGELRLAAALARFHSVALVGERRRILARALNEPDDVPRDLAARGFLDLAHLASRQGDVAESKEAAEKARRRFDELNDKRGVAWAILHLAASAVLERKMAAAVALYDECGRIFRELNDDEGVAAYLNDRSDLALREADYTRALELVEEAMALRRRRGLHEGAVLLYNAALALLGLGRLAESETAYRRGIERGQALGDRSGLCLGLFGVASVSEQTGMLERSARLLGAGERLREEIGLSLVGPELADHDRLSSSLQARLGEDLSPLLAAGRELELDEAVMEALGPPARV